MVLDAFLKPSMGICVSFFIILDNSINYFLSIGKIHQIFLLNLPYGISYLENTLQL